MSHKDSGWRPKGATQKYNGFEVWDHGIWPNEVNGGVVDGTISFDFGDPDEGAESESEAEPDEEAEADEEAESEVEASAEEPEMGAEADAEARPEGDAGPAAGERGTDVDGDAEADVDEEVPEAAEDGSES